MRIIAIDPGNVESAWIHITVDEDTEEVQIIDFAKEENYQAKDHIAQRLMFSPSNSDDTTVVIERIASMGMAVGQTVFETCEWVGRFTEMAVQHGADVNYIKRLEEKVAICGSAKAKDANIRQALIDRYAKFDFNTGQGTKKNPDVLYGISKDVWSSLAVATTWMDKYFRRGYFAE